jgi:hypothetical protein
LKVLKAAAGRKLKHLKTRLAYKTAVTNGGTGPVTTVMSVIPSSSAEYGAFAGLFDEIYVHGGTVHFDLQLLASTAGYSHAVMTYDPEDTAVLASIEAALVANQNVGPVGFDSGSAAAITESPHSVTRTGMWNFKFKCPREPQNNLSNTVVSTGMWASTSNTTATFGYLKPYWDSSAAVTATVTCFIVLDVSFRSRV